MSEGIGYAGDRFVSLTEPVVPIEDRAHQFGDGVYEVIRVYRGRPFLMEYHLERFVKSANFISLPLDRSTDDLRVLIHEAIARAGFSEAQVYFQLSRGFAKREHGFPAIASHLTLTVRPVDEGKLASLWRTGQQMILAEDIRWKHCHIKSLNLLPNVWTKQMAIDSGAHDAIFVRDDRVTECTSSNIAIVRDGVIITHPANDWILHGVTRRFLLEHAKTTGLPVEEAVFSPDSLFTADEVFTMGTLSEVTPVNTIDGREVGAHADLPGSIVRKLRSAIREAAKLA